MPYAAVGFGASYIMGHALFLTAIDSGSIMYNEQNNTFPVEASATVLTSGSGLHGGFKWTCRR